AFEHGAFAGHYAVIFAGFAREKRRKNVWQKNLLGACEIALGAVEILRHDAEIDVFRAQYVANLAKHFVDAHVGTGVARTVVACEEKFKSFAGLPARAAAHHPFQARYFDEKADPGHEKKISHERAAPLAVCTAAFCNGQGFAG